MHTSILRVLAAAAFIAAVPMAGAASTAIDQVVADAQKVRAEAQDVKQLLKPRSADPAAVQERLTVIEAHAQSLRAAIAGVRASETALTAKQLAALERADMAAETLVVMLANKAAIVADSTRFDKERRLLRAKADGIAQRAALVEKQMEHVRG
ncbi:MAG: hypothetical protein AB7O93_19545 [Vicinamibacterales bacterium]